MNEPLTQKNYSSNGGQYIPTDFNAAFKFRVQDRMKPRLGAGATDSIMQPGMNKMESLGAPVSLGSPLATPRLSFASDRQPVFSSLLDEELPEPPMNSAQRFAKGGASLLERIR